MLGMGGPDGRPNPDILTVLGNRPVARLTNNQASRFLKILSSFRFICVWSHINKQFVIEEADLNAIGKDFVGPVARVAWILAYALNLKTQINPSVIIFSKLIDSG